ncbi:MAG: EamA family transporter, partial [Ruminococcus sp.]|nr:EamA family transporter [Ruminococcus sp.]
MKKTQASILLVFVFIARGTSFLFSKELMNSMSPMSVLAVRFLLAFLILALIFFQRLRACSKRSLKGGLILGVLYTICMVFEMYGLRLIDSGTSALIENMAIVLVPLYVSVLTKSLPKKKTMLCAVLAVIGVGFLSVAQSKLSGGILGIVLTICAALTYAACIIATEKVSQNADPIAIGVIQLGVMGVLSLLIALPVGGFELPQSPGQWLQMLILVLLCSCFGFAFQPVGQKYVSAEAAAIMTVVNPLTASVLGIV